MSLKTKKGLLQSTMLAATLITGAAALTAMPTVAFAQDYTSGAIEGTVYTPEGTTSSGTTVTLRSVDRGFQRTSVTDSSGQYRFPRLPIGAYEIGVQGNVQEAFKVAVGATSRKDFVTSGDFDVVVATGVVQKTFDFEAATTGLTIDVDETFKVIPLPRNLAALTLLTPGAAGGDSAFGNLVSLGGSSVAENVYYVNGMNTTDFRNFLGSASVPFEFYEQVQTKTGGLPAEFGRTTGGVSNAVTKSGTNDWHFGASVYHENKELRDNAKNTRSANGDVLGANKDEIRERTEYNFWASGPIIKDRVFAYGLYSPRKFTQTSNSASAGTTTRIVDNDPFYGGKLDINVTDNHLVEFTGWRTFNERTSAERDATYDVSGNLLTTTDPAGGPLLSFGESGGDIWSAKYTGQMTDWLTVSAMYGEQENAQTVSSATDGNPAIRDRRDPTRGFVDVDNAANFLIDIGDDKRKLFRADADIYVDNLFGEHHFRVGVDREELTAISSTVNSGGIYYVYFDGPTCDSLRSDPNGEDCLRVREYSSGGEFDVETTAFYIQDAWDITDNLTLNLGIRNEEFENFNATGDAFVSIDNQWAPRTSFAYNPTFDQSGTFFGSYSKYFLPIAANTNIRSAGAETFIHRWYEFDSINADFTPNFDTDTLFTTQVFGDGTAPEPDDLVDRNLKPQNMDEYILGYRTDFGDKFEGELGNWSVGLSATYSKLNKVIEDISIDQGVLAYCDANGIADCDDVFGPLELHQYVITNPGNDVDIVVPDLPGGSQRITLDAETLGYPDAKRTYKAVELKFDRVGAEDGFNIFGSYTLSESKGNYEGAVKSDNGQDDTGLTTDFDFPQLQVGSNGLLPNHRAHKLKLYGNYEVSDAISVGANFQLTSPRKYGCLGADPEGFTTSLYGSAWYCEGQLTPRGSQIESDWSRTLDLNFGFTVPDFPVGEVTFRADVFNVLNDKSVLDRNENRIESVDLDTGVLSSSPGNYGQATRYQSPRYIRFGVDFRY